MFETQKNVEQILANPKTSRWLRKSLETALDRDPVDAFHDGQILSRVLTDNAAEALERALAQVPKGATGGL